MKDRELREMAKKRVEFRDHLVIFVIINAFLIAINLWFSPFFLWFPFILVFWGLGLAFHWRDAHFGTAEGRIEKEYQKLKKAKSK
ncbi:MAG: 2TM domain-containing protein [Candidatus Aenigmatarchaeota archaeon]|nr:MAG: 2TM domain-containing protein [Candidatus Aenigmarchaeota archaeon]